MEIKSLLKVTLFFTLCVIMHKRAYTRISTATSTMFGGC
jgi:hypothetical protein